MRSKAIVSIHTLDNRILYRTRSGKMSETRLDAHLYLSIEHALRAARKAFRQKLGVEIKSYQVSEIYEDKYPAIFMRVH
jgi:hypothetical protein